MLRKMIAAPEHSPQLFVEYAQAIEAVLQRAVEDALLFHKRAGNSIASWRDGKVVIIPAEEILLTKVSEDK